VRHFSQSVFQHIKLVNSHRLGRTDLQVTPICLGGVGIGGTQEGDLYGGVTDEQAYMTVHSAIMRGINFIDTAPLYCESERRLGLALSDLPDETRDSLIISTKVGDAGPQNGGFDPLSKDGVLKSVENSLKQLQCDSVDILLLHDITAEELEACRAPGGAIEGLLQLREQGVVDHLGLGGAQPFLPRQLHDTVYTDFMESGMCDVILTVNDANLVRNHAQKEIFPLAEHLGVGVMNAGVFCMGLLGGIDPQKSYSMGFKKDLEVPQLIDLATRMHEWCFEKGHNIRELALFHALNASPAVACLPVGCRTPEELDEVVDSYILSTQPEIVHLYEEFQKEFSEEVENFNPEWHFYYDKHSSKIN